jgi:catechol 2,3-dioxygenase-like lactoylglutathione lyase family enzyme
VDVGNEGFDHLTIVVTELDAATRFFGFLGFVERTSVVVSGEEMSRYMGIPHWKADHVTLVLDGGATRQEIQLLRFHEPRAGVDPSAGALDRTGFNHVCFRVKDLDAVVATLAGHGILARNEVMDFHDRRLVFLDGPGIVVELAEWVTVPSDGGTMGVEPIFGVADAASAADHYERLGFTILQRDVTYAVVHRQGVTIALVQAAERAGGSTGALYLHVDDADQLADEWRTAGLAVVGPVDYPYGKREGSHRDPDGNLIRFGSPSPR